MRKVAQGFPGSSRGRVGQKLLRGHRHHKITARRRKHPLRQNARAAAMAFATRDHLFGFRSASPLIIGQIPAFQYRNPRFLLNSMCLSFQDSVECCGISIIWNIYCSCIAGKSTLETTTIVFTHLNAFLTPDQNMTKLARWYNCFCEADVAERHTQRT